MILVLSETDDVHADTVEEKLRTRGVAYQRIDPGDLGAATLSVDFVNRKMRAIWRHGNRSLELSAARAVWLRRPRWPRHPVIANNEWRAHAEGESLQYMSDLWSTLPVPFLPGPLERIRHAENKQLGLRLALDLGLAIPPTLFTTAPSDLIEFYRAHDGKIIDKSPSVRFARKTGAQLMRYTELVTTRDIGYAQRLRSHPMLFQAYVEKRVELRVTVVGQRVFAAEIHSQATQRTRWDWRRYDHGRTPYHPHTLPTEIEAACVALVEKLGLRYGAIDFILTPKDEYVFLEINSNGQWLWVEQNTGLPIADAIADELTGVSA